MKRGHFITILLLTLASLVLLTAVEVVWSVRSYRTMNEQYSQQVESIFEGAAWRYAGTNVLGSNVDLGPIERFHAFVGELLRTSGIDTKYRVEVLATTDAEPLLLMTMGDEFTTQRVVVIERRVVPIILRLTVEDPHRQILASMRNMILSAVCATLLLVCVFIYLLRTLFRAKSLERIRRDLTHNITHELRTPLAAAQATTDLLRSMPELSDDRAMREEYLELASKELRRLSTLVDAILRSSLDDELGVTLHPERCVLQGVVEEVYNTIRLKYAHRELELYSHVEPHVELWADRLSLNTILLNLVDNGVKYSEGVAHVTISARGVGARVEITVEDRGMGIPRRDVGRIFDKFYRVPTLRRHDARGYGLGLYHVRKLVEAHHGTIAVNSQEGRGTRITITLESYGAQNTNC